MPLGKYGSSKHKSRKNQHFNKRNQRVVSIARSNARNDQMAIRSIVGVSDEHSRKAALGNVIAYLQSCGLVTEAKEVQEYLGRMVDVKQFRTEGLHYFKKMAKKAKRP